MTYFVDDKIQPGKRGECKTEGSGGSWKSRGISKEELEKWREHYQEEANTRGRGKIGWFYLGKREVIIDMLKMFEQLEG